MVIYSDELCHWGVKGMKWGIRRYQNSDGTLTTAGRLRYAKKELKKDAKTERRYMRAEEKQIRKFYGPNAEAAYERYDTAGAKYAKAASKVSTVFGRKKKAAKLEEASKELSEAAANLSKQSADYNRIRKLYDADAASYRKKAEAIAQKYDVSVSDLVSEKTKKTGKNYVDTFVKTGATLADFPIIGTSYYNKKVASKDAATRRDLVEKESRDRY